jgi:uncharacterized protein YjbI with pentapeptide repeats
MSTKKELQLIRKLRSPDNKTVVQAVEEMRAHGWLEDGTLRGVSLRHVHLQGADLCAANLCYADMCMAHLQMANLSGAKLEGVRFCNANLYGADLSGADLKGANLLNINLCYARNLTDEQLSQTKCLWGGIMSDGSLYDGRYNLPGDLEFARAGQIDINDPVAMARFYASPESYQGGQAEEKETAMKACTNVQLIRKLRNAEAHIVRQAVDELRLRGHLTDGSLNWAYLRYVNLQGADLSGADLQKADLNLANMQGVDLSGANLQGTRMHKVNLRGAQMADTNLQGTNMAKVDMRGVLDMTDEQLSQAGRLRCATMPDGTRYDGRFNLAGDLADARFLHVNTDDPQAMADFYAITRDQYALGQEWVQEHLPLVWDMVMTKRASVDLESLIEVDSES